MYVIQPLVLKNAKRIGVTVQSSTAKNKKLDVFKNGILVASVGDTRYLDYPSYLKDEGKSIADQRKRLYKIRHNKTRNVLGTPSYYADQLLWT